MTKLATKEETVEVKEDQILQMKREHDASIIDAQEETMEQDQVFAFKTNLAINSLI